MSDETEPVIDLHSDVHFMGEALRQAARAAAVDEVPCGAVIVREGRIIARAYNQVETLKDATAHAEMLAITQAESAMGDWRLTDCDLYVTKEPCPMCAGAAVHVRLRRVISAARIRRAVPPAACSICCRMSRSITAAKSPAASAARNAERCCANFSARRGVRLKGYELFVRGYE